MKRKIITIKFRLDLLTEQEITTIRNAIDWHAGYFVSMNLKKCQQTALKLLDDEMTQRHRDSNIY